MFGAPTSLLYRADLVRKTKAFYPNSNPHCDTTACYQVLEDCDFGFVHQVLSYTRIHAGSQTSRSMKFGTIYLAMLRDIAQFGPKYLTPVDLRRRLTNFTDLYYKALVPILFARIGNKGFWRQQRFELQEMGLKFSWAKLLKAACSKGLKWLSKPSVIAKRISAIRGNSEKIEARYYEQVN